METNLLFVPAILLVDDEPDIIAALEGIMEMELPEVQVLTAPDGPEALEVLEQQEVAMILSDFRMPKMDGLTFLREAQLRHGKIPSILLTAFPDRKLAVEAAQAGIIRRFYNKPPDIDQLINGIKELLSPEELKHE